MKKTPGIINPSKEVKKIERQMTIEPEPQIDEIDFDKDDEVIESFFNKVIIELEDLRNIIDRIQESIADIRYEMEKKEDKKVIEF